MEGDENPPLPLHFRRIKQMFENYGFSWKILEKMKKFLYETLKKRLIFLPVGFILHLHGVKV